MTLERAAQAIREQPRTTSARVVSALRRAIQSGELEGGRALVQEELAHQFGTSRIPVREALKQLEAEGLVRSVPHKGAVVSSLTRPEMRDLFEMMIALERRALRRALPALAQADLERAAGFLDQLDLETDPSRWQELHTGFHHTLYRLEHHPRFLETVHRIRAQIDRYAYVFLPLDEFRSRWQQEHRALLEVVRRGQTEEAIDLLEAHLQHAAQRLEGHLEG